MKKFAAPAISLGLLCLMSATIVFNNRGYQKVDAYAIADLPSTIDLNDCAEQEIRNYYNDLNSYNVEQRKGNNLLINLKKIISKGQKYYSYDSGDKIWKMYEIIDRDWAKSPASAITYGKYNPETNIITEYQYGSTSDGKNNPYIHALYNNRNIDNQARAWGDHLQTAWGINQEHIWAKSHGFDEKSSADSTGGARGDPMHLWAGNGWANNVHSNYFFAFVDKAKTYTDSGAKYSTAFGNLKGYPKNNKSSTETVFEPQDSDKGDVARAIFYMAARYNNFANETEGFDGNNPNLVLANSLSENSRTGTSSANDPFSMGLLSDLLAWNKLDPVDEFEIHRNNLLYKNYTNNRNPFIDFPEWADAIWGTADLDGKNYNSHVLNAADPKSDPIGSDTGFNVSESELDLQVDDVAELSATNAEGQITWTVDNDALVYLNKTSTVNGEKLSVKALKEGTTTIHATATYKGEQITKDIKIVIKNIKSISVSGAKTDFRINDKFVTDGLEVTVTYTDGTVSKYSTNFSVSQPDMSKAGKQTVTVTFRGFEATYEINIKKQNYTLYIAIGAGVLAVAIIAAVAYTSFSPKAKSIIKSTVKKAAKAHKKKASKPKAESKAEPKPKEKVKEKPEKAKEKSKEKKTEKPKTKKPNNKEKK